VERSGARESDRTVLIEGNHYFPSEDVNFDQLEPSDHASVCPWKGTASYYDVVVDGRRDCNAAWYYPSPSAAAAAIEDHVAFSQRVSVSAASLARTTARRAREHRWTPADALLGSAGGRGRRPKRSRSAEHDRT
jgi:hypothetical protein